MGWLADQRPDLLERYERLYSRGAYAPRQERVRLAGLTRGRGNAHRSQRWGESFGATSEAPTEAIVARQESLF
jgi:hypothetical protein